MRLRVRLWLFLAGINGALAVALGAVAAHALQGRLDAHAIGLFDTAARYHLAHALALGLAAFAIGHGGAAWAKTAALLFFIGIVLFSGSLYLYAVTGNRLLVFMTPFGGLSLIAGWVALAASALKVRR